MEFTTNDHVHLSYTDTGETDRQPIVFIMVLADRLRCSGMLVNYFISIFG